MAVPKDRMSRPGTREWMNEHHPRIAELLLASDRYDLDIKKNENSLEISRLGWDEKESDIALIVWMVQSLLAIDFSDTNNDSKLTAFLEVLDTRVKSADSTSYSKLDDSTIKVSKAHQGTTPFKHTQGVAAQTDIPNLVKILQENKYQPEKISELVVSVLVQALLHDWGKLEIADGDTYQYHAEISYMKVKEIQNEVNKQLEVEIITDQVLKTIRYHHILQLLDQGSVTKEELRELFPDFLSYTMLTVLTTADAASVEPYKPFAFGGLIDVLLAVDLTELPQIEGTDEDENKSILLFLSIVTNFVTNLADALNHQIDSAAKMAKYIQQKLTEFYDWLKTSGQEFSGQQPVIFAQLVKQLDELFAQFSAPQEIETQQVASV